MRLTASFERNVLLRDRKIVCPVHVSPIAVVRWQRLGQEAYVEPAASLERRVYFNYREIVERACDIRKPWITAFVRVRELELRRCARISDRIVQLRREVCVMP